MVAVSENACLSPSSCQRFRAFLRLTENVFDGFFLIVFKCEFHILTPHRETEICEIRLVKTDRLDRIGQMTGNRLEAAVIIRHDISNADRVFGLNRLTKRGSLIEISEEAIGVGHVPPLRWDALYPLSFAACSHPQKRCDPGEGAVMADGDWCFIGEGEKLGVFLEAFGHREFIGELVVALDCIPFWGFAGDRRRDPWLGDVVANTPFLPIWVAGAKT